MEAWVDNLVILLLRSGRGSLLDPGIVSPEECVQDVGPTYSCKGRLSRNEILAEVEVEQDLRIIGEEPLVIPDRLSRIDSHGSITNYDPLRF